MKLRRPETRYRCSFCGKSQEQVRRLIAGPGGVYICNECVALCNDIVAQDERATRPGRCTPWYRRAASWWRHRLRGRRHLGKALP